jgi:predicted amidophosphoribosyltransferase
MGAASGRGPDPIPTWIVLGTFTARPADPLHDLIRAARDGDRTAAGHIIDGAREAAPRLLPGVTDAVVIPVPSHAVGTASLLVQAAAMAIARARGWWYAPASLRRRDPVAEAKAGGTRDVAAEAATIDWIAPRQGRRIVLFDDVLRTGDTIRVCAHVVRSAGDERDIAAITIAAFDTGTAAALGRAAGLDVAGAGEAGRSDAVLLELEPDPVASIDAG